MKMTLKHNVHNPRNDEALYRSPDPSTAVHTFLDRCGIISRLRSLLSRVFRWYARAQVAKQHRYITKDAAQVLCDLRVSFVACEQFSELENEGFEDASRCREVVIMSMRQELRPAALK